MKEENSKINSNSNNIIKEKLGKLGIKPINYPVIEEKLKNALNSNKNNNTDNSNNNNNNNNNSNNNNPKKEEENNQNANNLDLNRDTSINSNSYSFNKKESNIIKFSKLFKIRNELASLAQNINIGERSLIKSVENSPKEGNRALLNSSPSSGKLPPIHNPYQKNKNFKDIMYHNRLYTNNNSNINNIQSSFSMISGINQNNSYSLNMLNPINRKIRNNKISGILKGKNGHPNNNHDFISDSILITKNNSNSNLKNSNNISEINLKLAEEIISLEKYNTVKTETMMKYRHETVQKDDDDEEKNGGVGNNHNKSIASSGIHNSISREVSNNLNDFSVIHVNIREKSFINPHDSMDIINTNKFIYDNISSSLIDIQKIFYNKTIKSIEHYHKWRKKMQKVRVSTLVPKNLESLGLNKNAGSVISETVLEDPDRENKEEEGEDLFGEFRDDYIEKKKEKEKLKQKKLQQKKEKEEMKLKNRILKLDEYELYATYKYSAKNFPEGREQFSFRYNLVDMVLFGGLVINKTNNYVWTLDPNLLEWERRPCDNTPIYPRYGHSGILYQKKFIVFGGKVKAGNYQYLADLDIFDLNDNTWSQPNFNSKTFLPLRRNHVAELVGHQIIIHGGMSEDNQILGDCHVLSLSPYKWNYATISDLTPTPALAGHACALVVPAEFKYNARMNLYKYPEVGFGKLASNKIREKGWYIFGGIDIEGNFSNELWILRLGKKPLEWVKPVVRGKPPKSRYSHTMNYFEEGNHLIVHGGRNDFSSDSFAFNDTHIFDLQKMEWQEIRLYSDIPNFEVFKRCGHSSIIYTNKLYIFGGMNNMNYIGSSLFIINLDFNYRFTKENEDNKFNELLKLGGGKLQNAKKNYEVKEFVLPPIK